MTLFKTIVFEFILGYIMQGFAIVLGIFAFNKQKISLKTYLLLGSLITVVSYFTRLLDSMGVNTIINILFICLFCIFVLKMPIYPTIKSTLLVTALLLVSEGANILLMTAILGQTKFSELMGGAVPLEKAIIGLPATVLFALIMVISYFILTKKSDNNGKIGS